MRFRNRALVFHRVEAPWSVAFCLLVGEALVNRLAVMYTGPVDKQLYSSQDSVVHIQNSSSKSGFKEFSNTLRFITFEVNLWLQDD